MGRCKFHDRPLSDCSALNGRSVGMQKRTPGLGFILEESFDGPLKRVVSPATLLIYTPIVPLANLRNVVDSYKIEMVCLNWLQL